MLSTGAPPAERGRPDNQRREPLAHSDPMNTATKNSTPRRAPEASRRNTSPKPPDTLSALMQFRQIFRAAKQHFSSVERSVGVTGAQLWALREIRDRPGLKVTELAEAMALHQSTVSNLLEALVRQGLVERRRSNTDQRVVHCFLSATGKRIVRKAPEPARGVLPDALAALPESELRKLNRSLRVLLEHMRVEAPSGAYTHLEDI
jgi:DNA-binding MarR family transcriptional regulator